MAVNIDATVGGASSNSYVTNAEADTYFSERRNATDWTGAGEDDQNKALIMATARIDQEEFEGTPVNPLTGTSTGATQALKWPRYSATDDEGWTYEEDVIPERVKRATMELALVLLQEDFLADTGLEGFKEVQIGDLRVVPRHSQLAGELPEHVKRYLAPVLTTPSGANVRLTRS